MLHEEQETLMGDVVNLPYTIGRVSFINIMI